MRVGYVGAGALILALAMSGCSSPAPTPTSSASEDKSASATPTPTPNPVLLPEGTAKENLPYFEFVVANAFAADPTLDSVGLAQKVAEAGFPAETIQYSLSTTAVGLVSDTADVATNFGGACLVAQFGPVLPEPHIVEMPSLAQGGCLIGSQIQHLG